MNQIILNSAKCLLCNDILISRFAHDFKTCKCSNFSVDGGNAYLRRVCSSTDGAWKDLSVMSDAPYHLVRISSFRGSYGVSGKNELHWIKLSEMTDNHLANTIQYCKEAGQDKTIWYDNYLKEVDYRKENNIIIGE